MRFLFNQSIEAVDLEGVNPNMTVLQWLRKNSHNGTKEGCASGDCGACTAVVGELVNVGEDKSIEYKSINTCIALVLSLSGKHLITVVGLAEGAKLHPVQQAMVQKMAPNAVFAHQDLSCLFLPFIKMNQGLTWTR